MADQQAAAKPPAADSPSEHGATKRQRVAFLCVVPSPYQRDLLAALAARPEVELTVFYMERAAPDSPWPEKPLAPYEHYLPGFWFALGSRRIHVNWPLPQVRDFDVIVLNTLMSVTAQCMMWKMLVAGLLPSSTHRARWMFWGEKLTRVHGRFRPLHWCARFPLNRASAIVGIGTWAMESYRRLFSSPLARRSPQSRFHNIPYHCDLTHFLALPRHPRHGAEVTFLFCGQMIARKGLDVLLEAFAGLNGCARLLLVGREAEWPALKETVPSDVLGRITYVGFQAPDDLPRFFAQADVFVLPSRYDGWGVVVNQALGAGLPLICSDQVGAWHDLGTEKLNGCSFPAGDAVKLRACMQHFLDEPTRIDEYGEASRVRAAEWQPAAGAAAWVRVLQSTLS